MTLSAQDKETLRQCLCALQRFVLQAILDQREGKRSTQLSAISEESEADTIYAIDKISDAAILHWFSNNWPAKWPVELIMEGLESSEITFPTGTPTTQTSLKCIIDPIDGTRGLMFDKRSAWILCAIAEQKRDDNRLTDIVVAAMTEIPTTRGWRADQISAAKGNGVTANSFDVRDQFRVRPFNLEPAKNKTVHHGFATISRFFPAASALLSQCEERLWELLYGKPEGQSPLIFNDQYISTGGQFYELLSGHDCFIADLRPLAFARLKIKTGNLACHPYDVCTALILNEQGCIVEKPGGNPLDAPLDTTTPVSWVAYANTTLAAHIRPALRQVIEEML